MVEEPEEVEEAEEVRKGINVGKITIGTGPAPISSYPSAYALQRLQEVLGCDESHLEIELKRRKVLALRGHHEDFVQAIRDLHEVWVGVACDDDYVDDCVLAFEQEGEDAAEIDGKDVQKQEPVRQRVRNPELRERVVLAAWQQRPQLVTATDDENVEALGPMNGKPWTKDAFRRTVTRMAKSTVAVMRQLATKRALRSMPDVAAKNRPMVRGRFDPNEIGSYDPEPKD